MSLVVFVLLILSSILSIFTNGKRGIVLNVVLIWWFGWLLISTFSIGGVEVASLDTYLIFICFTTSIFFGSVLYRISKLNTYSLSSNEYGSHINEKLTLRFERRVLKIAKYIVAPVVTFYFIKALYLFSILDNLDMYRAQAFGVAGDGDSILFGNGYIDLFYNLTIRNFIYLMLFSGLAVYVITGRLKILFIASVFSIMDATMMLGRFQIYYLIVFVPMAYYIKNGRIGINAVVATLIPISLLVLITTMRVDVDLMQIIKSFLINYHTFSFKLFDNQYTNQSSLLNNHTTYGIASLGQISSLFILFLRKFGYDVNPLGEVGPLLHESTIVGYDESLEVDIYANAFYSILYTLYLDGGIFFIIIFALLMGYFLLRFTDRSSFVRLYFLFLITYLLMFGIFQPVLFSGWLILIIMFYLIYYVRAGKICVK